MKRCGYIKYIVIFCLMLVLLSGCDRIFRQEFAYESKHIVDTESDKLSSNIISISDYDTLKQTLYSAIEAHKSSLSVKLSGYSGDVERDVKSSISEIMETSLAVYGVSSISYESTLILSYYEITYNITYSKTQQEFYEINTISSMTQFRSIVADCLTSFGTEITLQCDNLDLSKYDLYDIILTTYYSNPFYAIGLKSYEISYFPEQNLDCILRITFNYSDSYSVLTTKRLKAEDAFNKLVDSYSGRDNDQEKIKYYHDTLCGLCTRVDPSADYGADNITPDDTFTLYGALVEHEACSYGYSLTLQALCVENGISGMLVSGSANGSVVQWNMVYISRNWYHIDCAADDISDDIYGYGSFCVPDRVMNKYYIWVKDTHGYCTSFNVRYNYDLSEETEWLSIYNPTGAAPDIE